MNDLISRLTKATRPDREIDAAIAAVTRILDEFDPSIFLKTEPLIYRADEGRAGYVRVYWGKVDERHYQVSRMTRLFTASIDSALTLVPEGYRWLARNHNGKPNHDGEGRNATAFANVYNDDENVMHDCFVRSTPAIALCIAALKARAALAQEQRSEGGK